MVSDEPVLLMNNGMPIQLSNNRNFDISQVMQDGFLWGVPKKRVTIQKRLKKRFGLSEYPSDTRLVFARNDLVICERCGDHHESYAICRTCYHEVKEETEKIKKEIKNQIDPLEPKEQEVFLKFDNENVDDDDKKKFKIIEIERERPKWFTKNLMSKSFGSPSIQRNLIFRPEDAIEKKD